MWKKLLLCIVIFVILLALPLAIRWYRFDGGKYKPGEIPRPDLIEIEAPTPPIESFVDRYRTATPGIVLVDIAHSNRFDVAELAVLQARLSARGQRIELLEAPESLENRLRYAKALVVIAPGQDWTPDEIDEVEQFVDKGGRLLLITDPSRYGVEYDEWDFPYLDEDVPHMNDLAARFGLLFQGDYLYNTFDNAGNFRNIKLTNFAEHRLTQGLNQLVFNAAHSITSEDLELILTSGETRSSNSEREEELAVAVLAGNGAVLALGDLTFMTEPSNAVYDNDRFIANIADFLSGTQRVYELTDFPHFFDEQTDLIYAGSPLLDSDLLQGGGALQAFFADKGKELTVREEEDTTSDTIYFGLYEKADDVQPYLAAAQVTLHITPTQTLSKESESSDEEIPVPATTPTPQATGSPSDSASGASSATPTVQSTPTPTLSPRPTITVTGEITPSVQNRIEVESLGQVVVTGTSLLLLQTEDDRQVLVLLADTEEGLGNAVERLTTGNLASCLLRETEKPASSVLALCPTGEVAPGDGDGGWEEPEPGPPTAEPAATETEEPSEPFNGAAFSIVVVALDHGEGRYDGMTSAVDYEFILAEDYDVTVWSTAEEGVPTPEDLLFYDLVIWSAGDYEDVFGDEESDTLFAVLLEGIPMILSGAFIGDTDVEAIQRDIQVSDASHPTVSGFEVEEVISFVAAPSGEEYEMSVLEDVEDEGTVVTFVRGPESEEAGGPSIYVMEDEFTEVQVVFIGFPIYLLPEEAKAQLVLNTVEWLLQP